MNDAEFRRRAHAALDAIYDGRGCPVRDGDGEHCERCREDAALLAAGPGPDELAPGEWLREEGKASIRRRTDRDLHEHPEFLSYTVVPGHPTGFATLREAIEWRDRRAEELAAERLRATVAPIMATFCCPCCGGSGPPCPEGAPCCVQRIRARLHPLGALLLRAPDCTCAWVPTGQVDPVRGAAQEFVACEPCVARARRREQSGEE